MPDIHRPVHRTTEPRARGPQAAGPAPAPGTDSRARRADQQASAAAPFDAAAVTQALGILQGRPGAADGPIHGALQHVVDSCAQLFALDGCGLMLADDHGDLSYVVASDGTTRALEDAQLHTGQGPCVDAYLSDSTVTTTDTVTDPRWPALTGDPTHLGAGQRSSLGAVLGTPVRVDRVPVGSLDAHRPAGHAWTGDEAGALERFASLAAHVLDAAVHAHRAGDLAGQLEHAIVHRAPIERGVGYLMARDDLTQTQAFHLLRTAARSSRRPIGDVARRLTLTGRLPTEPDDGR